MGELSEQNRAHDLEARIFDWLGRKYVQRSDERQRAMGLQYTTAETHDLAKGLAALFDAARTEGREEGEPVAWMQSRFIYDADGYRIGTDEPEFRVGSKCPDESDAGYDTWYPLYASPIREPEISREAVIDGLASALHNAVLAITLNLSPDHEAAREGVLALAKFDPDRPDAILNLAPVGGWEEARPIAPLQIIDDKPEWQQIIDLFERHGLDAPPVRLRDELVNHLAWAKFGVAQ